MRPVLRGADPGPFAQYIDAAAPLAAQFGRYCSYCERYIETNLAVEHVRPKDTNPALKLSWTNFLLACGNCNSCKGGAAITLSNYIWPDSDNTLRAFIYRQGIVEVANSLDPNVHPLAVALHQLVGLDKDPGNPNLDRRPTRKDLRWKSRQDTWDLAQASREDLAQPNADTPQMRAQIARTALARGGFGIWHTVFQGDCEMLGRLINAFPGSAIDCFDIHGSVCKRPGGRL